jgi:hypothetical protein
MSMYVAVISNSKLTQDLQFTAILADQCTDAPMHQPGWYDNLYTVCCPMSSLRIRNLACLAIPKLLGRRRLFTLLHNRRRSLPAFAGCNLGSSIPRLRSSPRIEWTTSFGLLRLLRSWRISSIDLHSLAVNLLLARGSFRSLRRLRCCSPTGPSVGAAGFRSRGRRFCHLGLGLLFDVCHFFLGLLDLTGPLLLLSLKQSSRLDRSPRQWLEDFQSFCTRF